MKCTDKGGKRRIVRGDDEAAPNCTNGQRSKTPRKVTGEATTSRISADPHETLGVDIDEQSKKELRTIENMGLPVAFGPKRQERRSGKKRHKRKKGRKSRDLREIGSFCEAFYQPDTMWYPVEILDANERGEYFVRYVGYGNTERLPECWLRDATVSSGDLDVDHLPLGHEAEQDGEGRVDLGDEEEKDETRTVLHGVPSPCGTHITFDDDGDEDDGIGASLVKTNVEGGVATLSITSKRPLVSTNIRNSDDNSSSSSSSSGTLAATTMAAAAGALPHPERSRVDMATRNPLPVHDKYWRQRFRYFSRFNEGIRMDDEAWFSVTPERIAEHVAKRCKCDVIVDAFAGAGGNAIQFAKSCGHVVAVDINPKKVSIARHNATIYGVDDRIEFVVGDFTQVSQGGKLKADVVFLGPPWGGPDYIESQHFSLDEGIRLGSGCNGTDLFKRALEISHNIVYLLPRNIKAADLRRLASLHPSGECEMERNFINHKIKMVTAYFGDVARAARTRSRGGGGVGEKEA
eukprot:g121.t1